MNSSFRKEMQATRRGFSFGAMVSCCMSILALFIFSRDVFSQVFYDLGIQSPDVVFQTAAANSNFGYAFAGGDLNADGKTDLCIGAPGLNEDGTTQDGAVYVFWGGQKLPAAVDFVSQPADVEIVGHPEGSGAGTALFCTDVNGDRIDDLIVGAPFTDRVGQLDFGLVEIFFGRADFPARIDLKTQKADVLMYGEHENDKFGRIITAADFNGDMIDDILVSAPGATTANGVASGLVYLIQGRAKWLSYFYIGIDPIEISFFPGKAENNFTASSLAVGNFNGDAYDDFLIGTHKANYKGRVDCGETHLILGRSVFPTLVELDEAELVVIGKDVRDFSGWAVGAADFNADGKDEMIISTPGGKNKELSAAGHVAYFPLAGANSDTIDLTTTPALFSVLGPHRSSRLANSVAAADLDNDAIADVLFGIPSDSSFSGLEGAGGLAVVYGKAGLTGQLDLRAQRPDMAIIGGEALGSIASAFIAGDFDGDGKTDVVLKKNSDGVVGNTVFMIYGASLVTAVASEHTGGPIAPEVFALRPNHPNPFVRATRIAVDLFSPLDLEVVIYDLLGRKVRTLFAGRTPAGQTILEWNGLDDAGRRATAGIYFLRASGIASGSKTVRNMKMVLF